MLSDSQSASASRRAFRERCSATANQRRGPFRVCPIIPRARRPPLPAAASAISARPRDPPRTPETPPGTAPPPEKPPPIHGFLSGSPQGTLPSIWRGFYGSSGDPRAPPNPHLPPGSVRAPPLNYLGGSQNRFLRSGADSEGPRCVWGVAGLFLGVRGESGGSRGWSADRGVPEWFFGDFWGDFGPVLGGVPR